MDLDYEFETRDLIDAYLKNDLDTYNLLVEKYPEYKKIGMFVGIAKSAFEHFKRHKYCSFDCEENDFFSLIDCTFKGHDEMLFIESENEDIDMYPFLKYDRSCILYIYIPEDFDDNPEAYREDFMIEATKCIAENYVKVLKEDEDGLTGKTVPNPDYVGK